MLLDSTSKSLVIVLSGAVTTSQLEFLVTYVELQASPFKVLGAGGAILGKTNDMTEQPFLGPPALGVSRQVKFISISQRDTVAATVKIRMGDGSIAVDIFWATLDPGDQVYYTQAAGFKVLTAAGELKTTV